MACELAITSAAGCLVTTTDVTAEQVPRVAPPTSDAAIRRVDTVLRLRARTDISGGAAGLSRVGRRCFRT